MSIDFTAKRYGVLPSELLKSGDLLDLRCAEIAIGYEKFVKDNPGVKTNHGLTQTDLQEMINRVKSQS